MAQCLKSDETHIARLDLEILKKCADLLDLEFEYRVCSDLPIDLDPNLSAEDRVLGLCEWFGAKEYLNLPGGVGLYHPDVFKKRNIKLTFRNLPTFVYPTGPYRFEPNLSIIDSLMWNRPDVIKEFLDGHHGEGEPAL